MIAKDWDRHVAHAEELAGSPGFQRLRDAILDLAVPAVGEQAVDIGAGTGLLTIPLSQRCARVWAIDISAAMVECICAKAAAMEIANIEAVVASATSLPLETASVQLVVSNYCLHHLNTGDKRRALAEIHRVLAPDGRLVLGDMMFRLAGASARDRAIVATKVREMLRRGPAGAARLAKSAARIATGAGERPAPPEWWRDALGVAGFVDVSVDPLAHEGGIAVAHNGQ